MHKDSAPERAGSSGPADSRSYAAGQPVTCDFIEPELDDPPGGKTPKLECRDVDTGKKIKVKYDEAGKRVDGVEVARRFLNEEAYTEVVGSRVLWKLGFGADKMYPVEATCLDCPEEPWSYAVGKTRSGERIRPAYRRDEWQTMPRAGVTFPAAAVERKFSDLEVEEYDDQGWSWNELLELVDTDEQRIHREALLVMMAIIQHADAKDEQQRIYCADEDGDVCADPVLVVHDVGYTFGGGYHWTRAFTISKLDIDLWRKTTVFVDEGACKLRINRVPNSPLGYRTITEEGRAFAADLLSQLTREDLEALFAVARVELAGKTDGGEPVTVAAWADALERKIAEVTTARCRS